MKSKDNNNNNVPDIWEPVTITDLLNMNSPTPMEEAYKNLETPKSTMDSLDLSGTEINPEDIANLLQGPDTRTLDYDKITTVEHLKTVFKGLDLVVDYRFASEELKKFLKDKDEA